MKKIFKFILQKISRVIYWITPIEFRPSLGPSQRYNLEKKINEKLSEETFNNFQKYFKKSLLFYDKKIREFAVKRSIENDKEQKYYYLEFGTSVGVSANLFSKFLNKLYCFDSFEGLEEDWPGTSLAKSHFKLDKKIPKLNSNVEIIVGRVQDTLDDFLKKHNPRINFVHMDMDTYNPTKFTLERIKPYLVKNATILFDNIYNYPGWEFGEYKALKEVFKENEFDYLAFEIQKSRFAIKII